MKKTEITRLRTGAALSAFVLAGSLIAAPAFAQDTPASAPAAQQDAPSNDGDIVVTGTIFPQSDTHTALPVTVITSETLERAGITNVTDAIRSASADGAGSIGSVAIFEPNPDIIWVGTGEAANRNSSGWGNGLRATPYEPPLRHR